MGECFEQENIFPIIGDVIQQLCGVKSSQDDKDTSFALHDEIAHALLIHEKGRIEVQAALQRCPQHTAMWMADNMIQWWSQRYTTRTNEWASQFERKKIRGNWAYRPKVSSDEANRNDDAHTRSVQLSKRIWPMLIDLASVRKTITYKELGRRLNIYGQALQNFDRILAPIKYYCLYQGLPPLSAIVVYTGTGVPGSGAEADEWDIEKVFDYAWKERKPLIPSEDELAAAIQRSYAEAQQHQ